MRAENTALNLKPFLTIYSDFLEDRSNSPFLFKHSRIYGVFFPVLPSRYKKPPKSAPNRTEAPNNTGGVPLTLKVCDTKYHFKLSID